MSVQTPKSTPSYGPQRRDCVDHKWLKETRDALTAMQTGDDLLEYLPSVINWRGLRPHSIRLTTFRPKGGRRASFARLCDVVMAQTTASPDSASREASTSKRA